MTTYTAQEHGPYWIVRAEDGIEVSRWRKDEYADIVELKREIRSQLVLKRSDRLVIAE